MDGVDHLREDLAFVDRMIAECQHHITRLQQTTAEMSRDGQDIDLANDVLASFTTALTRHQAERKRVVSAIADGKSIAGLVADLDRSRPPPANIPRRKAARRANAPAPARRRRKSLAE
jgi:ABC-type transporter Mla subunit MlaD